MAPDEPMSQHDRLQQEMAQLSGRDLQLWLLAILMLLVLGGGVIVLMLPSLFEDMRALHAGDRYLPQLFSGLGVLIVLFDAYMLDQRRRLTKARQELVQQMLINERTAQLTLVDPLTELFNRRYLEQVLPKELSRADRLENPLSLIMIDLDGFKQVNDRFGHPAGDKLLVEVAQLLKRTFRACDIILRYGGDEFLILLPDTGEKPAQHAAERLLQQVTRWNAAVRRDFALSLSCGVAQYRRGDDFAAVLMRADERMYAEKACHKSGPQAASTGS